MIEQGETVFRFCWTILMHFNKIQSCHSQIFQAKLLFLASEIQTHRKGSFLLFRDHLLVVIKTSSTFQVKMTLGKLVYISCNWFDSIISFAQKTENLTHSDIFETFHGYQHQFAQKGNVNVFFTFYGYNIQFKSIRNFSK